MLLYFVTYVLNLYIADTVRTDPLHTELTNMIYQNLTCLSSLSIMKQCHLNNKNHCHKSVKFLFRLQEIQSNWSFISTIILCLALKHCGIRF